MRIVFVRHGHPDYARDCLTELGHRHADAAARRLESEGISRIFSSTCGRALETAQHLADVIGLPVVRCDFMREISWGAEDGGALPADGHPWTLADKMIAAGEPLLDPAWQERPGFAGSKLLRCAREKAEAFDGWMQELGYTREGDYYRVTGTPGGTVAAFGHGGESAAIFSHLFNLPYPFVCSTMGPDYTGITIVTLSDEPGVLCAPRIELLNDARHIREMRTENIFGN